MPIPDLPHLSIPLSFGNYNEQDSQAEIATCVEVLVRTPRGHRLERPDFGTVELEFQTMPLDEESYRASLEAQEPRADVSIVGSFDNADEAMEQLQIDVKRR